MVRIKDARVYVSPTGTYRNVEDCRADTSDEHQGPWSTHCLDHDQRRYFTTYAQAKSRASVPATCPVCWAFDQRCVYCPSNRDHWKVDPSIGFTPSTGHIMGRAVCSHHKYGLIPEGVDYLEITNVVLAKPLAQIYIGQAFLGRKVLGVEYQTGDQRFWLRFHHSAEFMTPKSAAAYHEALGFALAVAFSLNQSLDQRKDSSSTPLCYESWEELASRQKPPAKE